MKSVRFPWPFTLKKMPANNKKILSPACVNRVLIGSFIISNDDGDGDGDGDGTEKDKKAESLDSQNNNFARASRVFGTSLCRQHVKAPKFTFYGGH